MGNDYRVGSKVFYEQLEGVAQLPAFVLMRNFNLSDIYLKYNTGQKEQSRRFLECAKDKFLAQLVREPTRKDAPLDLMFTNREELVGDARVGSCLGQSNHRMVEIFILGEVKSGGSRIPTLDFQWAHSELFRHC